MKAKLPKASEKQIQADIMGYLRHNGYYVQRLNSGAARVTKKYRLKDGSLREYNGMIKLGEFGTPDIIAFKRVFLPNTTIDREDYATIDSYLDLLFVEVKTGYNKPSLHQKIRMSEMERYGARCLVAYSVSDVAKFIGDDKNST